MKMFTSEPPEGVLKRRLTFWLGYAIIELQTPSKEIVMNKNTKEFYIHLNNFIQSQNLPQIRIFGRHSGDDDTIIRFWREFMKDKPKTYFYEMISDVHWKRVPYYSEKQPSSVKGQASVFIWVFTKYISADIDKAKRIIKQGEGLWVACILSHIDSRSLSENNLMRASESNDPRVYKQTLKKLSSKSLNKMLLKQKMSSGKRQYITSILKRRQGRNLFSILSWTDQANRHKNISLINEDNAKELAMFLQNNYEEITKNYSNYEMVNFNNAVFKALSLVDNKSLPLFANLKGFSDIIKARIVVSEII